MGSLMVPPSGTVYVDTSILIYTVEEASGYLEALKPLWRASRDKRITIATSELAITEVLTGPMKDNDEELLGAYEKVLIGADVHLIPIDKRILREAARVRSVTSLRTPDAIHAATALSAGCAAFITNDVAFRKVPNLPVQLLRDCLDTEQG